jgi:hypothetical protein
MTPSSSPQKTSVE